MGDEKRPTGQRLVLASGSPRRRDLLSGLGLDFTVRPVDLDETPQEREAPRAYVHRLALEKAAAVQRPGEVILAADTIVVRDGEILGKPADETQAREMLKSLAGRQHTVLTGVAVLDVSAERGVDTVEESQVQIAALDAPEIARYVATGEPMDKAGSYAIQGIGAVFVEAVFGNYTNVVGLPLPATRELFARLGHDLLAFIRT